MADPVEKVREAKTWGFARVARWRTKRENRCQIGALRAEWAPPVLEQVFLVYQRFEGDLSYTSVIVAADGGTLSSAKGSSYKLVGFPSSSWQQFMEANGYEWNENAPFSWTRLSWRQRFKKRSRRWRIWLWLGRVI
jgi:hypothetical protein